MGIKPEVIVAPSALAEFAQKAATIQKAFALSPAMQTFVKQTQDFQNKLKAAYDKSGIAKLAKQIKNTFAKVKTWVKKLFVKYLPLQLPLAEIPRAQIQPSTGKVLQLPNSYRSQSPPLCSVIK
jgi:hypothetical protein